MPWQKLHWQKLEYSQPSPQTLGSGLKRHLRREHDYGKTSQPYVFKGRDDGQSNSNFCGFDEWTAGKCTFSDWFNKFLSSNNKPPAKLSPREKTTQKRKVDEDETAASKCLSDELPKKKPKIVSTEVIKKPSFSTEKSGQCSEGQKPISSTNITCEDNEARIETEGKPDQEAVKSEFSLSLAETLVMPEGWYKLSQGNRLLFVYWGETGIPKRSFIVNADGSFEVSMNLSKLILNYIKLNTFLYN